MLRTGSEVKGMWLLRAGRLLREYRQHKIHVTEAARNGRQQLVRMVLFFPERKAELELSGLRTLTAKQLRTRQTRLYLIETAEGERLLLAWDLLRGNHFAYCKEDVYTKLSAAAGGHSWDNR